MLRICKAMGADITLLNASTEGEPTADLLIRTSSLHGTTVEGEIIPTLIDEIPMIAVMAAFAEGTTVIRDAQELKVKESDRIAVVTEGLKRMGADIQPTDDGMIIHGESHFMVPRSILILITVLPCPLLLQVQFVTVHLLSKMGTALKFLSGIL